MTTRMLINDQRDEQLRVAIIDGPILKDYHIEIADRGLTRGNIYRGIVANLQPSLGAAFIDIGEERHGFLPVADVLPSAYHHKYNEKGRRPPVDKVLQKGRPILVQVTKDGVGQKGAALTTNLALAGRYLVLTPFDEVRGISRKAEDDKARKKIRQRLAKLSLPDGHGVIVRTNGLEQNQTTLNRDLNALLRLWKRVRAAEAEKGRGPRLLYSDQDLTVQALRDYLDSSIAEVLVDSDEVYEKAEAYMRAFMPRSKTRLERYADRLPLFSRYRLETQIEHIYERTAPLPGGGSLAIDATEALTAIDVNSGRASRADSHDETILAVNMEAAAEIARQLRLRDIGGLVVIDFIDMRYKKHQRKLEKAMRDAMKEDRARNSVGRISTNGLLEINRQRIKQAIRLRTHRSCPTCQGVGTVAAPEFAAWNLLRRIEARALTGLFEGVTVALHPELADALQNRHRVRLAELENELEFRLEVISTPTFGRAEERFEWRERKTAPPPRLQAKKTGPALTATDLAMPDRRDEDEDEERDAPRRRQRKRKKSPSKAKTRGDGRKKAAEKADGRKKAKADGRRRDKSEEAAEAQVEGAGAETDESSSEANNGKKPSRSRRRRRGSRRRKPRNGTAAAGESAGPDSAQPSADGDGPDGRGRGAPREAARPGDAEGETPSAPAKRRRSPRRKKSANPANPPDSAWPTELPAAASLNQASRDSDVWNQRIEEASKSVAAKSVAAKPVAAKPVAAKPVSGPSEQLRWQWWGGPDESKREDKPDRSSAGPDGES